MRRVWKGVWCDAMGADDADDRSCTAPPAHLLYANAVLMEALGSCARVI